MFVAGIQVYLALLSGGFNYMGHWEPPEEKNPTKGGANTATSLAQ